MRENSSRRIQERRRRSGGNSSAMGPWCDPHGGTPRRAAAHAPFTTPRKGCSEGLASCAVARYIIHAGLHGTLGAIIPGALSILKGAVPAGLVGSDIWRPPTFVGNPGSSAPTAGAAP